MKTISTMRALLAGALLLSGILTGCKKEDPPQPTPWVVTDGNFWDAAHPAKTPVSQNVPPSHP